MKNNKKKGGRPALENKKQFRINVRFDESEHNNLNQLTKKAHQSGLIEVTQECKNTIHHINHCINKLLHHDSEDN